VSTSKTFVIALGGNSLVRVGQKGSIEEQYETLGQAIQQLVGLFNGNNNIVITHGNGPQVGNLLLAIEAAKDIVPPLSLDICGAATEGFMGFMIQNTLANYLRQLGVPHTITTVISEVVVDKDDPAFQNPSKPIGPFYDASQIKQLQLEKGWDIIKDSIRGYRRIVPSPIPINIQQSRVIKSLLNAGEIVIAVGGGGIPVVRDSNRNLRGVEAVIDKDYASARLAIEIDADILFILTAVEYVYRDFGTPHQKALKELDLVEAKELLKEGQFSKGSMKPKIEAAITFLEESNANLSHKREVIITLPELALRALRGKTGTRITR